MSHLDRLGLTLGIIFASLAAGWITRRLSESGILPASAETLAKVRHHLQVSAIFGLLPLAAMLSLWGLPDPDPELLGLPLLGLASYISGGALALLAAHMLKMDRQQTGSFFCCGTFTNIGAVGGLVCLLFLGENSIALVALYRLVEEIYYFGVACPAAQWFGPDNKNPKLCGVRFQPALAAVLAALGLGIALRLANVPRPEICGPTASAAMILSTFFFLFAIGLTLRFSRIWPLLPQCFGMCAIKFAGAPAIVITLAWLAGYGEHESGLPLKTVAILCSMPVAMTALVPPSLFHLDVDLANACWIITTAGLVAVLPWLLWLLPNL